MTIVPNGLYELKLTAVDKGGNIAYTIVEAVVDGSMKLGSMKIGFTDLNAEIGNTDLRQHHTIMISQILLIFFITSSKPLNIGSDYVCELFPRTLKYHLKSVLLNYAVLP